MVGMSGEFRQVLRVKGFDTVDMPPDDVNFGSSRERRATRREVLRAAAAAGVSAFLPAARGGDIEVKARPAGTAEGAPWWMRPPHQRSRVVDVRSEDVLRGPVVDESELEQLLARGMRALTGRATAEEAWRDVLGPARRILLKFNSVGAKVLRTTAPMAGVLVRAISAAGYDPAHLTLVEVPEYLSTQLGVRRPPGGWGTPIPVGDYLEPLTTYWLEADAVVNVPFLKTHRIAGMSGCMKNVSHAIIRHPALFHDNGCSPYVGQVITSESVSSRLRLNVVNALRVVAKNGPEAAEDDLVEHGGLLFGCDPVAVDTVGLSLLAGLRRQSGLGGVVNVRYLSAARNVGVGRGEGDGLDQVVLSDGA